MVRHRKAYDPIIQKYVDHINGLLNSTITASRLSVLEGTQGDIFLITRYQRKELAPLELRRHGHFLRVLQLVRRVRNHVEVQSATYVYSLDSDPDNEDAWRFRYDYSLEPFGEEPIPHAHLHVNAQVGGEDIRRIHFPCGRLSIEQILACLINEYGIEAEENSMDRLAESYKGFSQRRRDADLGLFP